MVRIICILLSVLFANNFLFSKSATKPGDVRANFSDREKAWWAIQPIRKTDLEYSANPVDYFIQKKLESNELQLSPQAGPYEFVRRASFDLIGLPPSESEIEDFADSWKKNPDAAKKELIEKLLTSPS